MADPNLSQNPDDLTGRDSYIVGLALAYACVLLTSLARRRGQPPSSDLVDVRTLLRTYPAAMIAALLRQTYGTIVGEPITEEQFAAALAGLGVDPQGSKP